METSPNPSGKAPRVLACVLCQTRKIKCDRNSPCANCIKANVKCTPSTPAPARKRRRPNQDLQQRLARCEELLSEYASKKPDDSATEEEGDEEPWKPLGQLIIDDGGGVKFMDSYLWANIHDELRAMREILDDEDKEEEYSTPKYDTPTDSASPDQNSGLLLSDGSSATAENLHPQPAHVFHLWQTFLDRVNPLTKLIHVPTLQPMLVEAATNRKNVPRNVEALLFAIYTMAAVSMDDEECQARLGYTKEEAVARFSKGVRVTLMRIGVLKNYDLIVLQALVLFMLSLLGRYDRHAAWILNGTIVRIAQKMGLHRDGDSLGLLPFEAEMRRRIWWQIVMLDAVYALMSGLGQSMLPQSWNTKKPTNINDSDMFPSMTTIQAKDGPTDMIFCLVSYEMAKVLCEHSTLEAVILQNERAAADAPNSNEIEKARALIDQVERNLNDVIEKYGDLSMGPVHQLAHDMMPMFLSKIRELVCPPRDQPEWGSEVFGTKDNLFKISVTTGEHSLKLYQMVQVYGFFMWFVMTHFQIEVLIYMVGQLSVRTSGQLVDRAWSVVQLFYSFHRELFDMSVKAHTVLGAHTLRAWRIREKLIREVRGSSPEVPSFIVKLETLLPKEDSRIQTPASTTMPFPVEMTSGQSNMPNNFDMPWDQMLGFAESVGGDWNMFGSTNGNPATVGYGTLGTEFGTEHSGWM